MQKMKTPQPGDIVTPKNYVHRFTFEKEYTVESVSESYISIINDKGFIQKCEFQHFILIKKTSLFTRICNFVNKMLGI